MNDKNMFKEPNKIMMNIVYFVFSRLIKILFFIFLKMEVKGRENFPEKGGIIVMPNHSSYLDPPLVGTMNTKRLFRFMARHTLFRNFLFGRGIKLTGAFPVKRGRIDRGAWSKFTEVIKAGYPVVFFPEGTRTLDGELQKGKPGTGMLVYASKAPVLPVYIHGAYDIWPKGGKLKLFRRAAVIYGKPMTFEKYFDMPEGREVYEKITEDVMDAIKKLKEDYLRCAEEKKK
ncbi:MAG TPA: 1-acyl-sn-glycerol-3-phosphate acyltransferase [Firmicutes bacterium]|nr:1-acyl-sn-glycerol-3-phosphate acyltransferase [Bacillota bacterium]